MAALHVTASHARAFVLRTTLLSNLAEAVPTALEHLGYVQLDPLNICGRMQDLILRNRVRNYRPGDLLNYIHGSTTGVRAGFEHYIPGRGVLCAWPLSALPFIRLHLAERNRTLPPERRLSDEEEKVAAVVVSELQARGPLKSDDLEHEGRGITAWGTDGRLIKIVLEKLFARGDVVIAKREEFRRIYDLPERVYGHVSTPLPSREEGLAWAAQQRLQQHRLVRLKKIEAGVLGKAVLPVVIEGDLTVHCLAQDEVEWDKARQPLADDTTPRLLAPLDPVIYDRVLTRKLWGFDYTWEVYTPAEKRRRGYYCLPVLHQGALVGDVEPIADWKRRRLRVRSRRLRRGVVTKSAVAELARFLDLKPAP